MTSPSKQWFSFLQHLPTANSSSVRGRVCRSSLRRWGFLSGSVFYRSCAGKHSGCESMIAIAMLCPVENLHSTTANPPAFTFFLPLFHDVPWAFVVVVVVGSTWKSHLRLSTLSLSLGLWPLTHLCTLLSTIVRSFLWP